MTEERKDLDHYEASPTQVKNIDSAITGIAIGHIFTALVTFPIVYVIFTNPPSTSLVMYIFLAMLVGVILAAAIPLYIIIGIAIWRLYGWAWKVAVAVNILCLIFNIGSQVVLLAMLNIVLLLALNNTDVRNALQPYQ